jgi:hypothetical protein
MSDDLPQRLKAAEEAAKACTTSTDALLALMQNVDRIDPKTTAAMRKHGIIQQMQALLNANSDLFEALSPILKRLET